MNRFAIATTALCLTMAPASAWELECYQNENYLVIAQERTDEVGADFLIRQPARGKFACAFEEQPGDARIGAPDDPLHYNALVGTFLVLDRSTGPDGDLVIYDLSEKPPARVIDVPADSEVTIEDGRITYWERVADGNAENCSEYAEYSKAGLGAVIAEGRVFDTASGAATATRKKRCSATQ